MSLDSDVQIGNCSICGMILGEAAFLAVNGMEAFAAGRWMEGIGETHQYNHNFVFYVAAGCLIGALSGMWHYNRGPWKIPKCEEIRDN